MSRLEIDATGWAKLSTLLDQALDREPAARAAWIDSLGPELESLKPQLRDLLSRSGAIETGDFLATLPPISAGAAEDRVGMAGEVVGAYRLVRELGAGGMGSVWLAERTDGLINRPVALKLPHLVVARRAELAERMAREREILATLDHRNIAKLFDAGITAEGQPFLALEYVEGVAIDAYCRGGDGRTPLGLAARLALFRQVADAVAYAHGKLVVHRDLKPENILVTANGGVRLLDFGIAKLLERGEARETRLTELSGRALTPDYASPEQILGEPLTVASDVYSLGVILYELLTGERPYKLKWDSRGALEDAIVQAEPKRPSEVVSGAVSRQLRGDLDTIILKALKKNPQERYVTVNAFADDVTRHLDRRPVHARPDSRWYRTRKFVARNRVGFAVAVAVTLTVLSSAGVSVWQAFEANAQRDTALRQQQRAKAFSDFLAVLLQDAGGGAGGKPLTTTELLDRGVQMLERQTWLDESVSAYMWYELSRNYLVFNNARRELELLDRSAASARRLGDSELLAASECSAAWSMSRSNQQGAREHFERGRRALNRFTRPASYALMDCIRAESNLLHSEGDTDRAIEVIIAGRQRLAQDSERNSWRDDLLIAQLSDLYRASDRFTEALALSEESLRAVRAAGRSGSLAELVSLNNHAGNLCRLGEVAQCGEIGVQILQWVNSADLTRLPPVGLQANVGYTFWRLGKVERALELAEADLVVALETGHATGAAFAHLLASRALTTLGRLSEAKARLAAADLIWNADPTAFRRQLLESRWQHGEIALAGGDIPGARAIAAQALQWLGYPAKKNTPGIDRILRFAASANHAFGDYAAAAHYAGEALELSMQIAREPRASADVGGAALLRAAALDSLGRRAEATADLELAQAALTRGYGPEHADTRRARLLAQQWAARGS